MSQLRSTWPSTLFGWIALYATAAAVVIFAIWTLLSVVIEQPTNTESPIVFGAIAVGIAVLTCVVFGWIAIAVKKDRSIFLLIVVILVSLQTLGAILFETLELLL